MSQDRRSFLETVALGGAGLLLGCAEKEEAKKEVSPKNIALQLWTFRNDIEKNAAETLSKISDLGIDGVETAFWPDHISLKQGAKYLKDAGLPVMSVHAELPIDDNADLMLRMAEAYDCTKMVWHGWPEDERYHSNDGIHELAELYNESALWMAANGLELGLHNHWWEFEMIDGQYPFYLLLDHIDEDIFFEIDTYWAKLAGHDPAKVISDFGSRAKMLHMKDGAAKDPDAPMVALGNGVQDFQSIVSASRGNVDWYIIEFDACESDLYEAVGSSVTYLRGMI